MCKLTVNTGSMFSGKSTLLISQGEKHMKAGQRVLYIKPSKDDRYSESEIVTHTGERVPAMNVDGDLVQGLKGVINPAEVDVVLIDEVQFFSTRILPSVWWLLAEGVQVYASGLDLDFLGDGFDTTKELMALADKVNKLKAVCEDCGNDSVITAKRNFHVDLYSTDVVQLGAKETYKPLCRKCYINYMVTKGAEINV